MKFSLQTLLNVEGNGYGLLNVRIFGWILYGLTRRDVLVPSEILRQMIRIGVQALPMASLVALSLIHISEPTRPY